MPFEDGQPVSTPRPSAHGVRPRRLSSVHLPGDRWYLAEASPAFPPHVFKSYLCLLRTSQGFRPRVLFCFVLVPGIFLLISLIITVFQSLSQDMQLTLKQCGTQGVPTTHTVTNP